MAGKPRRPKGPDIDFTATVRTSRLRFDAPPETTVEFTGYPGHESASGSDRANLPDRVETGVVYSEVRVDYRIAAKLLETDNDGDDNRG